MNHHLFTLSALALLGIAGCGAGYPGTYKGEATEAGTLKLAVPRTDDKATNETPPRRLPDQTVTVTKDAAGYVVKMGQCELKGPESSPGLIVATSDCDVKVATFEGKLPLSATLKITGPALTMDVTGTTKNDTAVVTYDYRFTGTKQD